MTRILTAMLTLLFCAAEAPAEGPFASMSFADARKKAGAEKKMVFIDFHATWCVPCKMMDATTFKDSKVVEFLKSRVVALKIDAEKHLDLAEKYHVSGFPTLMFIKPDGSVAEVVSTYLGAAEFLRMAEDALAGRDTLSRLTGALKRLPREPVLHALLAETLAARGEHGDALKHCKRMLEAPDLDLVSAEMLPMVVQQVVGLGPSVPDAEALLTRLYRSAEPAVLDGKATNAQIGLFAAYHLVRGELPQLLEIYDRLLESQPPDDYLERVTALWRSVMIAADRHADIAEHVNIVEVTRKMTSRLPPRKPGAPAATFRHDDVENVLRRVVIGTTLDYYRVLTQLGRHKDAAALVAQLTSIEESAPLYNALAWTAYETGQVTDAHLAQARKALELAGGKDASAVDTLARILHALKRTEEAVALVERALKSAEPGYERGMLERCLADLRGRS